MNPGDFSVEGLLPSPLDEKDRKKVGAKAGGSSSSSSAGNAKDLENSRR